jgi:hypothetical protein
MKTDSRIMLICTALLLGSGVAGADETIAARVAVPASTRAVPIASSPASRFADPTLLSPRGFAAEELPAYDDFLHRAIAQKRIEIVRFVDRDDRRVFLGFTREGYLGIHVQKRDRR